MVIAEGGLPGAQPWLVLAVFVAVACITVIVPVLYYLMTDREQYLYRWSSPARRLHKE